MARRTALNTLVAAAVLLVAVALAWACVPRATLSVRPGSAKPGQKVRVSGKEWGSRRVPIQIRWRSPRGRLLASARGPSFRRDVRIPRARRGVYTIVATARFPDHVWRERAALRVR